MVITDEMKENYMQALKQKYSAVCLDVDGTLTKDHSKRIDEKMIEIIADLLSKRVSVLFITGRGETGLNDLVDDIVPILKNKYSISDKDLSRMYALLNDGARLFTTTSKSQELFNKREYLASEETLKSLADFNLEITKYFDKTRLKQYCDITYSYDTQDGKIVNMRFNINTDNEKVNNEIYSIISSIISDCNPSLTITKGIYEGKTKIQIGTTTKDYAIETAEKLIGVPANSMLRIGDCGNNNGNDYAMLDCPQGFSVKEIGGKSNCCFPIMDANFNVLTGLEATSHLLKSAKILPTICMESASEESYKKGYALIERAINIGRNKILTKYNDIFNLVFQIYNGVNDIFDKESGSVIIPIYEWELIDDTNPLKKFLKTKNNNEFSYILRDNNNILLRGSKTYYYFLANRLNEYNEETEQESDFTSKDNVVDWLINYSCYFKEALTAIINSKNLNDIMSKRMILGILDNARNVLLTQINAKLNINYENDSSVILNLEELPKTNDIKILYDCLLDIHKMMINACLNKDYNYNVNDLTEVLCKTGILLEQEAIEFSQRETEPKDYSKIFRAYREIDNFAENFITVSLVNEKNDNQVYGICGLSYGGIELPVIYKAVNDSTEDVLLLKLSKEISGYKSKHSVEIRNFDIGDYGNVIKVGFDPSKKYIIADDNLLTAKTMQLAINSFYDLGANVQGALVVRYPSTNRVNQMFLENHGAVDYNCFFDYVQGLCFPSPYSFRDEHDGDPYLDSLGIFDINRRKILECLYKNHDYNEQTEVSKLRGRVKK